MIHKQIAVVKNAIAKVKVAAAAKKAAAAERKAARAAKPGGKKKQSASVSLLVMVLAGVLAFGAMLLILVMAQTASAGVANPPTAVILTSHGEPDDGTDSVQSLTFDDNITGGTFRLKFGIKVTSPITWSATTDTLLHNVESALCQLSSIGVGGAHVSDAGAMESGHGTANVVFDGSKTAKLDVPALSVYSNSLTGSTHSVSAAVIDEGVTADGRSFGAGSLCVDLDALKFYVNNGEKVNVDWQPEATPATFVGNRVFGVTLTTSNITTGGDRPYWYAMADTLPGDHHAEPGDVFTAINTTAHVLSLRFGPGVDDFCCDLNVAGSPHDAVTAIFGRDASWHVIADYPPDF